MTWIFSILIGVVFAVVAGISKVIDKERDISNFSNYVLPFFTIGLIIWSYFIVLATLQVF